VRQFPGPGRRVASGKKVAAASPATLMVKELMAARAAEAVKTME
jgi:hypothetical protein